MDNQFKIDVLKGLKESPKSIPSKYFYDKKGDELFIKIMNAPEYYLTRAEFEIFQAKTDDIITNLNLNKGTFFELIELGAGNGLKTKQLLKKLDNENYRFKYLPIDISQSSLDNLEKNLLEEMPNVSVIKKQGDYFDVLQSLKDSEHPKVVLFLGSNIGNLSDTQATKFIHKLGKNLKNNAKLLLGVDLIKDASIVLPAYNDSQGYTREFNLNLLRRINDELGANFNLEHFIHQPEYDEIGGIAKSFLVSTKEQEVKIDSMSEVFSFSKNEKIHTEISRKYNDDIIRQIISDTDFKISAKLTDSKEYFANYILTIDSSV